MVTEKNNFGILKAYVLPHPPIILPEVGMGEENKIEATSKAIKQVAREIAQLAPDTIILSSPHAPIYPGSFFLSFAEVDRMDLGNFGCPFVKEELKTDLAFAEAILLKAEEQNITIARDSSSDKPDHGSLIPLRFICSEYKDFNLVRIGPTFLPGETHYRIGQIIAEVAEELKRRVVFIASGDLSHVLKSDGPYGFMPEGPEFDQKMADILSRAAFDEILTLPKNLVKDAAQCGLCSFQIMAGAFDGREVDSKLLSYEGPFGVGYLVARFAIPADRISVVLYRSLYGTPVL